MRKFLKFLLILFVIVGLILLWAVEGLDNTPYFESSYYKVTKERLDSLKENLAISKGKVFVGFGKQNITPVLNTDHDDPGEGKFAEIPLAGYGGRRGKPATGIHDSLFVKSIAIRAGDNIVVLVGSDLLIMPPAVSALVAGNVSDISGLDRKNLFFSATHTHSSVGAWSQGKVGEMFGGAYNLNVVKWLADKITGSIELAVADMKPGRIGTGNFNAEGYVSNRLVGEDGLVDTEFMIVLAEQNEGKRAVIGSFDAHATTLGDWNMETSGDYPGYWQRKLENSGFDMAVFHAGSVGSHTYRSKGEKFEKTRYIGEALADSVVKYSSGIILHDTIIITPITLRVEIPEFHIRVSDGLRLNQTIATSLFPDVGDVYLQALRLDDLIWVTTPGDFSGETTIGYRDAMRKRGFRVIVSSFNGAYTGYVIPCKYYHFNSYESRLMNWFGPAYNPYINYLVERMMEDVSIKY